MDKPEALRLEDVPRIMDNANAELRRQHGEIKSMRAERLRSERRLLDVKAQRDALLEALKMIAGKTPCFDNLMGDKDIARAAIKAVEETK